MATKTIGTAGRDYSTFAAYAAYLNALSLSAPEIGVFYNDSGAEISETGRITVGGWSGGSGTNTVSFACAAGQSIRDSVAAGNALDYDGTRGVAFTTTGDAGYGLGWHFTGDYLRMTGLQFRCSNTINIGQALVSSTLITDSCIYKAAGRTGSIAFQVQSGAQSNNDLFISTNGLVSAGIEMFQAAAIVDATNVNTAGNSNPAINCYNANSVCQNTVSYGYGTFGDGRGANAASTNNATSSSFNGSNWGNSGVTGITSADFVAAGTDWSPSAASLLRNAGATVGLTHDFANRTRPQGPAYDIGCLEYVSAGPTFIAPRPLLVRQAVNRASTY